jgi:hypothetical protein
MVGIDRAKSVLHLVGRGLGVAFTPPPDLARHVRDRLFPWTSAGAPWTTLLWCNGRMALPALLSAPLVIPLVRLSPPDSQNCRLCKFSGGNWFRCFQ